MCTICDRSDRAEIENAVLNCVANNTSDGIDKIAEQYGLDLEELKMHALFHTPMVCAEDLEDSVPPEPGDVEKEKPHDSLTRRMKLREADALTTVSNEYLVTLKTMGRRINKLAQVSSIDIEDQDKQLALAKLLTKPMVDLYIGLGGEIRQTVKTIADIDHLLNGPDDSTGSGLMKLAEAINQSGGNNG